MNESVESVLTRTHNRLTVLWLGLRGWAITSRNIYPLIPILSIHSFTKYRITDAELISTVSIIPGGPKKRPKLWVTLTVCIHYSIWETGEWPEEWTFSTFIPLPKKAILSSVQTTKQLLLSSMQARSFLRSYWKRSEWRPKRKLQVTRRDSDKEGGQEIKSRISEYWCTRHASTNNHSICVLWTSRRRSTLSAMISSGWLWWKWDTLYTWLTCWPNYTGNSLLRSK